MRRWNYIAQGANALLGSITANQTVNGSAYDSVSGVLYIVGQFTQVTDSSGNIARNGAAAIDVNTALFTAWNPNLNTGVGWDVKLDSSGVYITWDNTSINGGTTRQGIAKVDKTNGTIVAAFNTLITATQFTGMALTGTDLYAGTAGVGYVRKFDATTGAEDLTFTAGLPVFSLSASGYAVLVDGSSLILTGSFLTPQRGTVKLNFTTGAQQTYDPGMTGGARTWPCIKSTDYYFGGSFTAAASGTTRNGAASLTTASTPSLQSWDPLGSTAASILSLYDDGTNLLMGGIYASLASGATAQQTFAKVNKTTGAVVPAFNAAFSFGAGTYVRTISPTLPNLLFAGGSFDPSYGGAATVGGKARYNMVFLDATTGASV